MKKNRLGNKKLLSCVTAVAVALSMTASPVLAAESGNVKDETVYVITDAAGSQKELIVSDHLKNRDAADIIKDVSPLEDIENVKGEEKFQKSKDGTLSWKAAGSDIYYQGKTDKSAPVTMDVKYYLDGREVKGEQLEGKSGNVKIVIHYENNASVNVDGKNVTVPFAAISGMIVDNGCFENVNVSSGKVIDDGDKQFIMAMALPGTAETLGVSEDELGFGSTVEITGKAKEFDAEDIMTIVTSDFFNDVDNGKIGSLDLDGQVKELDSAAKQLCKGTDTLYKGLRSLDEKSVMLSAGVSALNGGAQKLSAGSRETLEGSRQLADGSKALSQNLNSSLDTMKQGAGQLQAGSETLYKGLQQVQAGINGAEGTPGLAAGAAGVADGIGKIKGTLDQSIGADAAALEYLKMLRDSSEISEAAYNELAKYIGGSKALQEGAVAELSAGGSLRTGADNVAGGIAAMQKAVNGAGNAENPGLTAGAKTLYEGLAALNGGIDQATADTNSLTSGASDLAAGADKLLKGENQVSGGAEELAAGMNELNTNTGMLVGGINQLDLGSKVLNDGMNKFYHQGIEKLVSLYNSKLKGSVGNIDSMIKAGKRYDTFTQIPGDMKGSVKFIYRTQISAE